MTTSALLRHGPAHTRVLLDVQMDVLVGVIWLEMDELRDHEIRRSILVDVTSEEDDAVVEKTGVDVERPLTAGGLFNDHRNEGHAASLSADMVQLRVALDVAHMQPFSCRVGATTMTDRIEREIVLPAPVAEVWLTLTNSGGLSEWLAEEVLLDLRPGGEAPFVTSGDQVRTGWIGEVCAAAAGRLGDRPGRILVRA